MISSVRKMRAKPDGFITTVGNPVWINKNYLIFRNLPRNMGIISIINRILLLLLLLCRDQYFIWVVLSVCFCNVFHLFFCSLFYLVFYSSEMLFSQYYYYLIILPLAIRIGVSPFLLLENTPITSLK